MHPLIWLLGLCIALQGSVVAMTRGVGPAHFHLRPAPMADAPSRDPMLDLVRVVLNHHGIDHRHESTVERHAHEPGNADVVYLDDDPAHADLAKNTAAKRVALDLDTLTVLACEFVGLACVNAAGCAPSAVFESHVGKLPERPPR